MVQFRPESERERERQIRESERDREKREKEGAVFHSCYKHRCTIKDPCEEDNQSSSNRKGNERLAKFILQY